MRKAPYARVLDHVPGVPWPGRDLTMISRIPALGYINTADIVWISELQRLQNMGLPMVSFQFQLRGMTAPITSQSHTRQPDGTWMPTSTSPAGVEESHMALVRAWEADQVKP